MPEPRDLLIARCIRIARCLSVSPAVGLSHAGIASKRLKQKGHKWPPAAGWKSLVNATATMEGCNSAAIGRGRLVPAANSRTRRPCIALPASGGAGVPRRRRQRWSKKVVGVE